MIRHRWLHEWKENDVSLSLQKERMILKCSRKKEVKLEKEKVAKEEESKTPLQAEKVSKNDFGKHLNQCSLLFAWPWPLEFMLVNNAAEDLPTNSEDMDTEEIIKKEESTINAVAVLLWVSFECWITCFIHMK